MPIQVSNDELSLLSNLQLAGIPVDGDAIEAIRASKKGLSVYQTGGILDTRVFELLSGETGYMLDVQIHNDSPRAIRLAHAQLRMPWPDQHFRWLEDPLRKKPRELTYSLPKYAPSDFEREAVLNHCLAEKIKLHPGDSLEGLLLGVGPEAIPDQYQDRQALNALLTIFDSRGNAYPADITFCVTREPQRQRKSGEGVANSDHMQPSTRLAPAA